MTLQNIIQAAIGAFCLILYGWSLRTVISLRKKLAISFVAIYSLTAVVNFLTYLNVWISLRLHQEKFFNFYYSFYNRTIVIRLVQQTLIGFFYYAQNVNCFLLIVDRFIHIGAREWIQKWERYWWKLAAFLYIFSLLLHFFMAGFNDLSNVGEYVYNATQDSYSFAPKNRDRAPLFFGAQLIFGLIFITICACIIVATYLKGSNALFYRVEDRSFTFIALVLFASQTANIIAFFYFSVVKIDISMVGSIAHWMNFTTDLLSLGPGVYSLLLPGPIRHNATKIRPMRVAPMTETTPTQGRNTAVYLPPPSLPTIN